MTNNIENFRKNLEKWQKRSGKTYQQIADDARITRGYLNDIKGGKRKKRLNMDILQRISDSVGCKPSDLIDNNEDEKREINFISEGSIKVNEILHTKSIITAKDVLERNGQVATYQEINNLSNKICSALSALKTDVITENLIAWIIETTKTK